MPSLDRKIDPKTGDFVAVPGGAFQLADVLENKLALSFTVPRGSWEGDPDLGHRFAEVARAKDLPVTRQRIADLAQDAVAWLIQSGELDHVDVLVESFQPGKVAFEVDAFPPAGDKVHAGPFFVSVGGE